MVFVEKSPPSEQALLHAHDIDFCGSDKSTMNKRILSDPIEQKNWFSSPEMDINGQQGSEATFYRRTIYKSYQESRKYCSDSLTKVIEKMTSERVEKYDEKTIQLLSSKCSMQFSLLQSVGQNWSWFEIIFFSMAECAPNIDCRKP